MTWPECVRDGWVAIPHPSDSDEDRAHAHMMWVLFEDAAPNAWWCPFCGMDPFAEGPAKPPAEMRGIRDLIESPPPMLHDPPPLWAQSQPVMYDEVIEMCGADLSGEFVCVLERGHAGAHVGAVKGFEGRWVRRRRETP